MGAPYIYDISRLRVNLANLQVVCLGVKVTQYVQGRYIALLYR